jgi:hypothetical protein
MSYDYDDIAAEQAYDNAVRRKIINATRAKFERTNPDAMEVIDFLHNAARWSEFAKSLLESYGSRGGLSIGQMAAARSMVEKAKVRDAERLAARNAPASSGKHVSTVGKREDFTLTINKVMTLDGMYGTSYLHLCTDAEGNEFTYKGTAELGEAGITVRVKATVKEHGAYNGVARTVINRPKVL